MPKYVVGLDCGTGGMRVGIFKLNGEEVRFASCPVALSTPKPGYAEQNPLDWWEALCTSSKRALKESGIDPGDIIGLSISAMVSTLLFTDENLNPLRPAILWCDVRSSQQARRIAKTDDPALKYNGYDNASAEWAIPEILWVKENEPHTYDGCAHICDCMDYLGYKLTGQLAASINTVTIRWYYDNRNGGWPVEFFQKIGVADILGKVPQQVLPLGALLGHVSPEAAGQTGIPAGTPVGMGGCDGYVSTLGLGITQPGIMTLGTGSSHFQYTLAEQPFYDKGVFGAFPDAVIPGLYSLEAGQASTGTVINWFKNNFCSGLESEASAKGLGVLDYLATLAEDIPPGSENLIVLDCFQGNRSPLVDGDIRGMMYGLSLKHTPAHIYRGILEGICYGTEHILRTYEKYIPRPGVLYAAGGPSKSRFFMQLHADVSGLPIKLPACAEATCLGAAVIGAVVGGAYASLQEAAHAMVRFSHMIEPDMANHEKYKFYADKYIEFYPMAKDWMHQVTTHEF